MTNEKEFALKVFRSLWGCEINGSLPLVQILPQLKALGFDGFEASLGDIKGQEAALPQLLDEHGLEWICGVYTSWQDYEGDPAHQGVAAHLVRYREQLTAAAALRPMHINAHSGSDAFSEAENDEFFAGALALERELQLPCGVSHETHRGRSLFSPWETARLVRRFPELRLTADYSHWVVVCEHLLTSARAREVLELCAPRVDHVHSRVGQTQHPQVADPASPEWAGEVALFNGWWAGIWRAQRRRGRPWASVTPEYGPAPYTPTTPFTRAPLSDVGRVVAAEAERQRRLFAAQKLAFELPATVETPNLPIIDVSPFLPAGHMVGVAKNRLGAAERAEAKVRVAAMIHHACTKIGFLYIVGHGVSPELVARAFAVARQFFALPEAAKRAIAMSAKPLGARGYQKKGENVTLGRRDWHEAIDFYRELPDDHAVAKRFAGAASAEAAREGTFVMSKNQWPAEPADFRPCFAEYIAAMLTLASSVMRAFAASMGLAEDYFQPFTDDSYWVMRVIGYPPLDSADASDVGVSCGKHTDYGCLTVLAQDSTHEALQVENLDGTWLWAHPVPGSFVVNIGDVFERWNPAYKSTPHRVVNRRGDRVSIPFFFEPNYDAQITPIKGADDAADGGKAMVYGDHLWGKVQNNFDFSQAELEAKAN